MSNIRLNEVDKQWVLDVVEKLTKKLSWVSEKSSTKIPYSTDETGTHDDWSGYEPDSEDNKINWWTNGFWGGLLWLMYHETGDEKYASIARWSQEQLDHCFEEYYGLHHDVGFMWLLTSIADYRLTENKEGRRRGLHAANLLAGRFNPVGKFIRAWNDNFHSGNVGWAIIDCMMNIPLLYWATEETNDPRFKQIAMMHADTAMNAFVRPDGSVNHIVEFNPETGELVKTYGGQGYEEGSSWTRGQAWGLYGFAISYIRTGKIEYLDTAKRIAHYFMSNIPESGLIPIDFRQPKEPALEDSCASCIAACGLIEIAKHVGEHEKDIYLNAAIKLLKAIDEHRSDWTDQCDSFVLNCSASYHDKKHHFTIIYADYYFTEAIMKLKENDIFLW
jgi:unsaturated chondroitin disaccharide hydrolase